MIFIIVIHLSHNIVNDIVTVTDNTSKYTNYYFPLKLGFVLEVLHKTNKK